MAAKVSVVIPTWNRGYCIARTIESVLAQTLGELEVLVCDDGSTDDTADIVRRITDPRVRWVPGPRGGRPAIPRNRGIREASGEWIAFLDSDDVWLPNKLAMQMAQLRRTGLRASAANALRLLPNQNVTGAYLPREKETVTFAEMAATNWVICSSAVLHRSLFDRIGFFPEAPEMKAIEDYAYWLRVATCGDIAYCSIPLLYYTDDPLQSIRQEAWIDVGIQRRRVLADFQAWSGTVLLKEDAADRTRMLSEEFFSPKGSQTTRPQKQRIIDNFFGLLGRKK